MDSVSRISAMLESARDLTVEAHSASAGRVNRAALREMPFTQIKKLLDSRHDREVLEGLRKVVSMMHQRKDCLLYFSSVVKNVASPNIEIKKLVYIFLLHYAESEPDLALLSINTIQKSLSDPDPQVRAMALKTMSGIRVPVISQIVSLAIKKGCADMSPYVRKAAALAIPKCYRLDPGTIPQLTDYISLLLGDKQYFVVGSAIMAFLEVCPDNVDLIHPHYRALVRKLVDMDDWGQLALIRMMTYYSRKCFPRHSDSRQKKHNASENNGDHDLDPTGGPLDPDLDMFLKSCKSLLSSRNSAITMAVARCFASVGTPEYLKLVVGPMIGLLRCHSDLQQVVLCNLVVTCISMPSEFVAYFGHFLIRSPDSHEAIRLKLELLTLIFPHAPQQTRAVILSELEHFTTSSNKDLVRESVRAIGRCAHSDSQAASQCLNLLLTQASSPDGVLVGEALGVVRQLVQQNPDSHTDTIIRLAKNLDTLKDATARSSVIWLVGEFSGIGENNIAPDVLRLLVQGFADEPEPVRLQVVLLAAKVYAHHLKGSDTSLNTSANPAPDNSTDAVKEEENIGNDKSVHGTHEQHPIAILWEYVLLLARYDTSYDLRDRARLFKALLADPASTQMADLLLLAPKPVPTIPSPTESRKNLPLGSTSLVVGPAAGVNGLNGNDLLPDWVEAGQEPDPRLRDEAGPKSDYPGAKPIPASVRLDAVQDSQSSSAPKVLPSKNKNKTLDDWLAEDDQAAKGGREVSEDSDSGDEESDEDPEEEDESEESDEDGDETSDSGETEEESEDENVLARPEEREREKLVPS